MDKGVEEEFSKAKIDELVEYVRAGGGRAVSDRGCPCLTCPSTFLFGSIEIRLRIINLQGVQVPAKSPVVRRPVARLSHIGSPVRAAPVSPALPPPGACAAGRL